MEKKSSLLILFSILIINFLNAQQQGNNWYFGNHAGISFNGEIPIVLNDGALSTMEGCATISDANGQLLFYTDGTFVYNKNHQIMPNGSGLMGNPSSSNSAIIIRKPGSDSLYYVFTVDAGENDFSNGYRYSVVNISLNNGLGDITIKNNLLYTKCSEKITAVRHANGTDVWIVTKDYTDNTYRTFRLSCSGLEMNPVISNVGLPFNHGNSGRVGSIKASPDGNKIATVQYFKGGWEIFDFDKSTGILYNPLFIPIRFINLFGIEFSPNSKLIYLSSEVNVDSNTITGGGTIYQYKINIHDSITISNSKYEVSRVYFPNTYGDMQLGPNGKIYIPNQSDSSLSVINSPDKYGSLCGFSYATVNLGYGRLAQRCLPAFFKDDISNSVIDFKIVPTQGCDSVEFNGSTSLLQPVSWYWDFGDGNTGSGQKVTHSYLSPGNFIVKLFVNNQNICGANGIKTKIVNWQATPLARFGFNTICGKKTVQFKDSSIISPGIADSSFWDFGDGEISTLKNPQHTYKSFGEYVVKLKIISFGLCTKENDKSILVHVRPLAPQVFLGVDTVLCKNEPYLLNAGSGYKDYTWQNGSTDSIFTVTKTGIYFVKARDHCDNSYLDTIRVTFGKAAAISLGKDTSICKNYPLTIGIDTGFTAYQWNTGAITKQITVDSIGEYQVAVTNAFGCISKDSIRIIDIFPTPNLAITKQSVLCLGQNNILKAGTGYSSYLWQNGSTDSNMIVNNKGLYKVTVANSHHCFASDSVTITGIMKPPTRFLDKALVICNDDTTVITPNKTFKDYLWSTGNKDSKIFVNKAGQYWLKVIDQYSCTGLDSIMISLKDCSASFFAPNAFTPNNDGLNDTFKPILTGHITDYVFTIFNRYGQVVFISRKPGFGWDGSVKDMPQESGIYTWFCRYKAKNEPVKLAKSTVFLLR